jgi:hypothetical protein
MAKPPATGPHSDIEGVNRDARVGRPNRDARKGTAEDIHIAEKQSKGRPPNSGKEARKS